MNRILLLNFEFPPLGGGGGVAAKTFAQGFIQQGYEVDVVTSRWGGTKKYQVEDGLNIYRVPIFGRKSADRATFVSMFCYVITGLLKGFSLCRQYQYSFINTHFVVPTGPVAYVLSRLFGLKNILVSHGNDIYDPVDKFSPHKSWWLRPTVRFLLTRADLLVTPSRALKNNIERYYTAKVRVNVIPYLYIPQPFRELTREELGLREDLKYLICVGRFVPIKNLGLFIRVLARLDKNVHGLIIGDGPEKKNLELLTEEIGISDRIHFLGKQFGEKKFQYLSCADVYVLSSISETLPVVLQEAMQVGLPIVATKCGGSEELVENGFNGLLVGQNDPAALAEAVKKILADGELADSMSAANRKLIQNFDAKRVTGEYLKLLAELEA